MQRHPKDVLAQDRVDKSGSCINNLGATRPSIEECGCFKSLMSKLRDRVGNCHCSGPYTSSAELRGVVLAFVGPGYLMGFHSLNAPA